MIPAIFFTSLWYGHGFNEVWKSLPTVHIPTCCLALPFHHQNVNSLLSVCPPPPPPPQIGCILTGLLLLSYFHLNLIDLILHGVSFNITLLIKYASKNSSYIAIESSCYSSETQHLLKFANRV